jgi:hypothetical protein
VRTRLVGGKLEIYRAEVKDTPTELRELANREPVVQGGLLE